MPKRTIWLGLTVYAKQRSNNRRDGVATQMCKHVTKQLYECSDICNKSIAS